MLINKGEKFKIKLKLGVKNSKKTPTYTTPRSLRFWTEVAMGQIIVAQNRDQPPMARDVLTFRTCTKLSQSMT